MKAEDRLLFLLTRQVLQPTHVERIRRICAEHPIDWTSLYGLARAHGVGGLVGHHLQQLGVNGLSMPVAIGKQFRISRYNNILRAIECQDQLKVVLRYLNGQGVDVMLLKGTALAQEVYQLPWLVLGADIDIVLRQRRTEMSDVLRQERDDYFGRLKTDSRWLYGCHIEYDYYEHHDVTLNGAVSVEFDRVWADAQRVVVEDEDAYRMCPEDLLLSLCLSSCRKRYFRLKSLFDIAETVAHYAELDWTGFVERSRSAQCQNIAYAALLVTQETVGCAVPACVLEQLAALAPRRAALIRSCAGFLMRHVSLSRLSCQTGRLFLGRPVGLSLVLPYVTYNYRQARTKLAEAYQAWRTCPLVG